MEYAGWKHPGMCASNTDMATCWYDADQFLLSNDGGYHSPRPSRPPKYLLSLPYKFELNKGLEGYSVDTNILKVGDWYYATVFSWASECNQGQAEPDTGAAIRAAKQLSYRPVSRKMSLMLCSVVHRTDAGS